MEDGEAVKANSRSREQQGKLPKSSESEELG